MIKRKAGYTLDQGITQSMLASFLACRQRSKFQLDRWESVTSGEGMAAMDRGSLYHHLLEMWYAEDDFTQAQALGGGEHYKSWFSSCIEGFEPSAINQEWEDTLAGAETIFYAYIQHWAKSDAKRDWISLEQVFDIKWRGYRLRGKFDGVFTYTNQPKPWLFETKTKATIEEDMIQDALAFDFQNLFYLTALKALGTPAAGVVYNILRTPSERTKKGESVLNKFTVRLPAEIKADPAHYFKRFEVAYHKDVTERFESELEAKLKDFTDWWLEKIPHYRNETACISRTRCPFLKACSSGTMVGYKQTRVLFRELTDAVTH